MRPRLLHCACPRAHRNVQVRFCAVGGARMASTPLSHASLPNCVRMRAAPAAPARRTQRRVQAGFRAVGGTRLVSTRFPKRKGARNEGWFDCTWRSGEIVRRAARILRNYRARAQGCERSYADRMARRDSPGWTVTIADTVRTRFGRVSTTAGADAPSAGDAASLPGMPKCPGADISTFDGLLAAVIEVKTVPRRPRCSTAISPGKMGTLVSLAHALWVYGSRGQGFGP